MNSATQGRAHRHDKFAPTRVWKSSDGTRLAGDTWGNPTGTPVILLHASGQTRHAWSSTARALGEAGCHAIAFDARGHGDSDWSPVCNYSQGAMVRDLESIVAQLGGRRPVLVGAGMGGNTSLLAVGERYLEAQALVLVNFAPQIEPTAVTRLQTFLRQQAGGFAELNELIDAGRPFRPQWAKTISPEALMQSVRSCEDGKYRWHWDPGFAAWPLDLSRRELRLAASARNVRVPTLLVRGKNSEVVSEVGVRAFLRFCQHAEYEEVRDAGHTIAGERNDAFGDTVLRFLQHHSHDS